MIKVSEFDIAEYLDSEEAIASYLAACLEDEDPNVFLRALGHVAKARGMMQLAKETGLGRESLYKSLSSGAKPRFDTIVRICKALNVPLGIKEPAHS